MGFLRSLLLRFRLIFNQVSFILNGLSTGLLAYRTSKSATLLLLIIGSEIYHRLKSSKVKIY